MAFEIQEGESEDKRPITSHEVVELQAARAVVLAARAVVDPAGWDTSKESVDALADAVRAFDRVAR